MEARRVADHNFPSDVVTAVLVKSQRRCCYCFGLFSDVRVKRGQIAHVDRNRSNAKLSNAAWLCMKHHELYDSTSKQAKGHTPGEIRHYRAQLHEYLASPQALPAGRRPLAAAGVSLELFDRRIPVYRATVTFIREVLKLHNIELQEMLKFAAATDEALFLFDDNVAKYLLSSTSRVCDCAPSA